MILEAGALRLLPADTALAAAHSGVLCAQPRLSAPV